MEKEFIKKTEQSVTLNVTAGKIDSFREIEKTTGTVRVLVGDWRNHSFATEKGRRGVCSCRDF